MRKKLELSKEAHQQVILMCGSFKEWQIFIGVEASEAALLKKELGLKSPADFVRSCSYEELSKVVMQKGGFKAAASFFGVSESTFKTAVKEKQVLAPSLTEDVILEGFEQYKSIQLTARMLGTTVQGLQAECRNLDLDVNALVDWSHGENSNAKGRRAEEEWAAMQEAEGYKVTDRNIIDGSKATYDFDHPTLGKVNVKSSRQADYTAKTRAANPAYWKFSTRGADNCDVFALVHYDRKGEKVLHVSYISSEEYKSKPSTTVTTQL